MMVFSVLCYTYTFLKRVVYNTRNINTDESEVVSVWDLLYFYFVDFF